jgi:c(7)-type cytochrome triheme protein
VNGHHTANEHGALRAACATTSAAAKGRSLSLALLLVALLGFMIVLIANARAGVTSAQPTASAPQDVGRDYSSFSHTSQRHASLECAACHLRRTNSSTPTFPGHKACADCHLAQFVTPSLPMCAICHTNLEAGNPPLKAFPTAFKERFNMKFDHAQHNTGAARPQTGCAFCHTPTRRGVALSIPAGLSAHNQCYVCHTPGAQGPSGRDISSCAACHAQAPYARTRADARAFRASFSHADHGARQRLGCADCHNLTAGLPQSRQVSRPLTAQHFANSRAQSCMTCHNGRRAFGDADFGDCKRCHRGATFRMPV